MPAKLLRVDVDGGVWLLLVPIRWEHAAVGAVDSIALLVTPDPVAVVAVDPLDQTQVVGSRVHRDAIRVQAVSLKRVEQMGG